MAAEEIAETMAAMVAEIILATVDAARADVAVVAMGMAEQGLGDLQEPIPAVAVTTTMARPVMPVEVIPMLRAIVAVTTMARIRIAAMLFLASN